MGSTRPSQASQRNFPLYSYHLYQQPTYPSQLFEYRPSSWPVPLTMLPPEARVSLRRATLPAPARLVVLPPAPVCSPTISSVGSSAHSFQVDTKLLVTLVVLS